MNVDCCSNNPTPLKPCPCHLKNKLRSSKQLISLKREKITEDHYNSILVVPEIKVTGYKKKKRFISIQMKDSEKRIRWLAPSHIKMTNRLVIITQTWHPFHLMNTDSILCKYVAQKKVNSDYISIYGLFFLIVDLFNCWIYENVEFQ